MSERLSVYGVNCISGWLENNTGAYVEIKQFLSFCYVVKQMCTLFKKITIIIMGIFTVVLCLLIFQPHRFN